MKSSLTLEDLDQLLGHACADLNEAAGGINNGGSEAEMRIKRILADALVRVWDARDIIHTSRPDLKPEYLQEAEADPSSHGAYLKAALEARQLMAEGKSHQAIEALNVFASSTSSAYFAQLTRMELAKYRGAI